MSPLLPAIGMGAILSFSFSSSLNWLKKKGLSRYAAINILVGALLFFFFGPLVVFIVRGSAMITETLNHQEFLKKFENFQLQTVTFLGKILPTLGLEIRDIEIYTGKLVSTFAGFILRLFSSIILEVPTLFLFSIITLVSVYFFLSHEEKIRKLFDRYFHFPPDKGNRFVEVFKASSREVVFVNVVTGATQAIIVSVGSVIFNVSDWFQVFFICFISSFIPILGAGAIALGLSIFSFAIGENISGFGMLVVSIVTGSIDNLIRPYLASLGVVAVPASIVFLTVIGGVIMMGLPGLFFGPILASLFFGVLPIILEDYFESTKDE